MMPASIYLVGKVRRILVVIQIRHNLNGIMNTYCRHHSYWPVRYITVHFYTRLFSRGERLSLSKYPSTALFLDTWVSSFESTLPNYLDSKPSYLKLLTLYSYPISAWLYRYCSPNPTLTPRRGKRKKTRNVTQYLFFTKFFLLVQVQIQVILIYIIVFEIFQFF